MKTLTKKQQKDLIKAYELIKKAQELFEGATGNVDWCPMFGQTESAIERAKSTMKGYAEYKNDTEL